jgi:hypothetical protein
MNAELTPRLRGLMVVAGLAIPTGFDDLTADSSWALEEFQKGEPPFFLAHIRCGIQPPASQTGSRLVFSGGQTRQKAEPISEAQGYFMAAGRLDWHGEAAVKERATT